MRMKRTTLHGLVHLTGLGFIKKRDALQLLLTEVFVQHDAGRTEEKQKCQNNMKSLLDQALTFLQT